MAKRGFLKNFSLVDWTQLRRHGYVFRMEYEAFLSRYKMLSVHTWPHWNAGGSVDGVTCLLRDLPISANEYAFGRTKIFIRTSKTVSDIIKGSSINHVVKILGIFDPTPPPTPFVVNISFSTR